MELSDLLELAVRALERMGIEYFVTGSMVTSLIGDPRFTNDIDIVVDLRGEHVTGIVAAFDSDDFYVSANAVREAIRDRRQFNVLHTSSGLKIDFMVRSRKDSEFEESRFSRVLRYRPAAGFEANRAAAEDVILKKMVYYREGESEKHLRDITGVLKSSPVALDLEYVAKWAERLNVTEVWEAVLERLANERRP